MIVKLPAFIAICTSFVLVAQTTTTEAAQSLLIFSEDQNIFQPVFTRVGNLYSLFTAAQFLRLTIGTRWLPLFLTMPIFFYSPQDFVHQGPFRCSNNEIRSLLSGKCICKKRIYGTMERCCDSGTKDCAWSGLPQLNIRYILLAAICPPSKFFLRYFS